MMLAMMTPDKEMLGAEVRCVAGRLDSRAHHLPNLRAPLRPCEGFALTDSAVAFFMNASTGCA